MAEQYEVRLTADNEISDEARDAAKALDKLPESVEVEISADTKKPARDIDQLVQKLDRLGAGEAANLLLTSNARDIVREIADLTAELDQLDSEDPKVDVTVANLQQLQGDLDRIQAKAQELNGTQIQLQTSGAKGGIDEVTDSARGANSALANMVGNSAQDLGELAAVSGSAGVAVGQMAEYFSDARLAGEGFASAARSMATVLGPIAALGVATQFLSAAMEASSRSADLAAENVQRMTDAIREGGDATDNYVEALRQTEDAQVQVGNAGVEAAGQLGQFADLMPILGDGLDGLGQRLGLFGEEARGLSDVLRGSGIDIQRWADIVTSTAPDQELARLEEFLRGTNLGFEQQRTILHAAEGAQEDWAKAQENATRATEFYGASIDESTDSVDELKRQQEEAARAAQEMADQLVNVADAADGLRDISDVFEQIGIKADVLRNIFELGNAPVEAAADVRDIGIAIDELSETAKDVNFMDVIAGNAKADPLLDAIDQIRPQVQAQIVDTFSAGGPEAATAMANSYIDQVTSELGGKLTREEVARLLGLENIEAVVGVALEQSAVESARRQLEILTGITGQTPYTAAIALALDAGTITGEQAQTLIQQQLGAVDVPIPSSLQAPNTAQALADANTALGASPIDFLTSVDTSGAEGDVATFAADAPAVELPVTAETSKAETGVNDVVTQAANAKPLMNVNAETREALNAIILVKAIAALNPATIRVLADATAAIQTIDNAARPRSATISATASGFSTVESQLNNLTRERSVIIRPNVVPTSVLVRVDGGG